jgi:hypothetical protein
MVIFLIIACIPFAKMENIPLEIASIKNLCMPLAHNVGHYICISGLLSHIPRPRTGRGVWGIALSLDVFAENTLNCYASGSFFGSPPLATGIVTKSSFSRMGFCISIATSKYEASCYTEYATLTYSHPVLGEPRRHSMLNMPTKSVPPQEAPYDKITVVCVYNLSQCCVSLTG